MNSEKGTKATKIAVGFAGKDEIETFLERITQIEEKGFEKYLVAYIDFLGIKQRMRQKSSFESLQILKFILSRAKKNATFIAGINIINDFDIKVFSDNVIIAQKVNKEILCDQIISIINLVALIQFEALFQFDFPLRGGITIGELYIDNSIVWGAGLIDSYNMENVLANYPRVLVSKDVLDAYQKSGNKTLNLYALLEEDFDGVWFVNYLLAAPNLKLIPEISASLRDKAESHANEDLRVRQKINWIISQFNSMCLSFKDRGNYEQYVVPYI